MPRFSVIVPVFGQPGQLSQCLESIRASTFEDYEILVSDDGSPEEDAIRLIASEHGARLIRSDSPQGSAAARNRASDLASGDQIVFVDSDVTLGPETLASLAQTFDREPGLDAVIGSYDGQPGATSGSSQFRTLLRAYAHQHSKNGAGIWNGCGAIQRERFLALGGFKEPVKELSNGRASIGDAGEDTDLGLRLKRAGGRVLQAPEIRLGDHSSREPGDLHFPRQDRFAAALTALLLPILAVALRHGTWWWILALALVAIAALHASLFRFLAAERGPMFAVRCFPLLLIYDLTYITRRAAGFLLLEHRRDPWLAWSVLALGCLILGLQIAGGAYKAEFNGHPDEPSHLVSGLMVYDYSVAMPRENPFRWAARYYLHYPKVAIGHWPPGFYVMEALWWLVFEPSRWSALLLNAVLALLAAVLLYRLIRELGPTWLALCAALLLIATPVLQQSYDLSMADVACLLWSVLVMDATARLLKRPSASTLALVALWLICALLTKGTGACLAPMPFLALLISGKWRRVPLQPGLIAAAAVLLLGFSWYAMETVILGTRDVQSLGGFTRRLPWGIQFVPVLAGYGFAVLGCAGACIALIRWKPLAVTATATLLSIAAVSFFLRAMGEPRHWIIVLPCLLVLSAELLVWLQTKSRWGILAGVPALLLFPFALHHQQPLGVVQLLSQVHRPSRMLVSSTAIGEGAWIAEVALAEKRPSSVVVRATKVLASMNWNGNRYRLITKTPSEVGTLLDQLGIETVILELKPAEKGFPHQALLKETLQDSDSWRMCATGGTSTVYCRIKPPSIPPSPLKLDLRRELGRFIRE